LLKIKFLGYSLLNLLNININLSAVLKTMDQGISYLVIVIVMVSHLQPLLVNIKFQFNADLSLSCGIDQIMFSL